MNKICRTVIPDNLRQKETLVFQQQSRCKPTIRNNFKYIKMHWVGQHRCKTDPSEAVMEGRTMQMAKYGIQRTAILARLTPLNT